MGPGTYTGTMTTSGSTFAPDNKIDPGDHAGHHAADRAGHRRIACRSGWRRARRRTATAITLSNLGQGTLTVQGAKTSGAAWITG